MSILARQYESEHAIVRVSIESKTTEGHSTLSRHRAEIDERLGEIVSPSSEVDAVVNAVEFLTHFDEHVKEYQRIKQQAGG